jgi:hypothetical protein
MRDFLRRNQHNFVVLLILAGLCGATLIQKSVGGQELGEFDHPVKQRPLSEREKEAKALAAGYNNLALTGAPVEAQRARLRKDLALLGAGAAADTIADRARPAEILMDSDNRSPSFIGGVPALPDGVSWPRTSKGLPLAFIGSFDMNKVSSELNLPISGNLLVFEDFDVNMAESDAWKSSRLILVKPGTPTVTLPPPAGLDEYSRFKRQFSKGRLQLVPDDADLLAVMTAAPNGPVADALGMYSSRLLNGQQVGGIARTAQGPATESPPADALDTSPATRAKFTKSDLEPRNWRLIVQVNGDEDMMFGDGGSLYCLAPVDDIKRGSVDRGYCYWDSA